MTTWREVPFGSMDNTMLDAWTEIRQLVPALHGPFFDPAFVRAVHETVGPVTLLIGQEKNGEISTIWPVHRRGARVIPVGWPGADFQGPLCRSTVDPTEMLTAIGARTLFFDHLLRGLGVPEQVVHTWRPSPYLDVTGDWMATSAGRAAVAETTCHRHDGGLARHRQSWVSFDLPLSQRHSRYWANSSGSSDVSTPPPGREIFSLRVAIASYWSTCSCRAAKISPVCCPRSTAATRCWRPTSVCVRTVFCTGGSPCMSRKSLDSARDGSCYANSSPQHRVSASTASILDVAMTSTSVAPRRGKSLSVKLLSPPRGLSAWLERRMTSLGVRCGGRALRHEFDGPSERVDEAAHKDRSQSGPGMARIRRLLSRTRTAALLSARPEVALSNSPTTEQR